jgi:hypothetical protein
MSAQACCANASSLVEGAWSAVSSVDPRSLSFPTALEVYRGGGLRTSSNRQAV